MNESRLESTIFLVIIIISLIVGIWFSGSSSTEELYRQECSQMLNC